MRKLWRVMMAALLVFWPAGAVLADGDVLPHHVDIIVVGTDGLPYPVDEIGCAWSADPVPTDYEAATLCTECSSGTCIFMGPLTPAQGAYIVKGWSGEPYAPSTQAPTSALYGQVLYNELWHYFGMWYTNAGGEGNDWEGTHVITYTVQAAYPATPTPTPIPTLTPFPTPTAPSPLSVEELSDGFGMGFTQTYGTLTGYDVIPDFGLDHTQWLFYARKWVQFINSGNLLWVMGGVLLAVTVLVWALDQLKNPR